MRRTARTGQDLQTRLIVEDCRFAPSKPCELCGKPTLSSSVRCLRCLEAQFQAQELAYMRDLLHKYREMMIELAHDKKKLTHLALLRSKALGWCGARLTQKPAKRPWAHRGEFPPELCARCLAAYEGMEL